MSKSAVIYPASQSANTTWTISGGAGTTTIALKNPTPPDTAFDPRDLGDVDFLHNASSAAASNGQNMDAISDAVPAASPASIVAHVFLAGTTSLVTGVTINVTLWLNGVQIAGPTDILTNASGGDGIDGWYNVTFSGNYTAAQLAAIRIVVAKSGGDTGGLYDYYCLFCDVTYTAPTTPGGVTGGVMGSQIIQHRTVGAIQ